MEDFIDGAALFSDVYAACGMKIVLSGTDSLGFYFTEGEALVYSLMKDNQIKNLDNRIIQLITEKIMEGVLGHMLEDIVIYETKRKLMPKRYDNDKEVIQFRFENHEYDMVIYDRKSNTCETYEIKHTSEPFHMQYRHLENEDFINATEKKFGKIKRRCVLYKGQNYVEENGVEYKNVEEYLIEL